MKYVACYGDSLVQGFPFGPRYSWTAQVEKLTQIKMLNYGVCGDCCDDIIYRMRQYALPEYVHHVIFLGGANDILQGRRIEDISRDYKRVLEWCEEKQYSLCVVLPFIGTVNSFAQIFSCSIDIAAQVSLSASARHRNGNNSAGTTFAY